MTIKELLEELKDQDPESTIHIGCENTDGTVEIYSATHINKYNKSVDILRKVK